ncbi:SsrA-binding protein SmpB [bacterium]|nr:SsrA-binding protein SmpB [bacterium]
MNNKNEIVIIKRNKAMGSFNILEKYESGIVLVGSEVKSVREKRVSLKGSYCSFTNNELFLIGMRIDRYENNTTTLVDPIRKRKLLLKKIELFRLRKKVEEKGLTIIPVKIYFSRHLLKVEIALVTGKRQYDKREDIKKRDINRELSRLQKHKG